MFRTGEIGGLAAIACDRQHDEARDDHRDHVRREQHEGAQCERRGSRPQADADDPEWRHQGDGDGHAGQHITDVATGDGDRADEAGGEGGQEVDERR